MASAAQSRYSAGLQELEEILKMATELDKKVVLIVDGIDHITRVLSDSRFVAEAETDIVEQLASIKVSIGTSIIIGSQPKSS